jgi:hypothetical protein
LVLAAVMGWDVQEGYAPHYAKGLMAKVAARRDMRPVACMVSSPIHPIGGWQYVYGVRTGALRFCKIVDVSHPRDVERHIRTMRIAEIAFEDTRALCGSTRERVVDCPIIVIYVGGE